MSAWHNAHKKLVWCTERVGKVIDFWVAFSDVVIVVRHLSKRDVPVTAGRGDHSDDHEPY